MSFEQGGDYFRASTKYALQQARAFVYNFFSYRGSVGWLRL
jgi:hypothetical protein